MLACKQQIFLFWIVTLLLDLILKHNRGAGRKSCCNLEENFRRRRYYQVILILYILKV